jgi:hypothetical protein
MFERICPPNRNCVLQILPRRRRQCPAPANDLYRGIDREQGDRDEGGYLGPKESVGLVIGPSLRDRIGDARVVLLGEASHGTSEFYRMRDRISRELIAKKGFRFVAIEGDPAISSTWQRGPARECFLFLRAILLSPSILIAIFDVFK